MKVQLAAPDLSLIIDLDVIALLQPRLEHALILLDTLLAWDPRIERSDRGPPPLRALRHQAVSATSY